MIKKQSKNYFQKQSCNILSNQKISIKNKKYSTKILKNYNNNSNLISINIPSSEL